MEMNVLGFDPYFSAADRSGRQSEAGPRFRRVPRAARRHHLPRPRRRADASTCSTASGCSTSAKPNLLVINDARGEVVDEFALADALKEKKIAGAAIDVYRDRAAAEGPSAVRAGERRAHAAPGRQHRRGADGRVSVEACKAIVAYLQERRDPRRGQRRRDQARPAARRGAVRQARAARIGALLAGLLRGRLQDDHAPRQRHRARRST